MNEIIVSSGDIGGINIYAFVKAALKYSNIQFTLFLNKDILQWYSEYFSIDIPHNIKTVDIDKKCNNSFIIGKSDKYNAYIALLSLQKSIEYIKQYNKKYLLTMPVNKYTIAENYKGFSGHTEFLAKAFNCKTTMLLYSEYISVVPLTTHISLSNVERGISFDVLKYNIENIYTFYKKRFNKNPKIKVLCVNPHCSDNGLLSDIDIRLTEWIKKLKNDFDVSIPISADTAFNNDSIKNTDVFLCGYHDQALIPFKMKAFYNGINITLGLPFYRVSPDHGPVYDKANNPEQADITSIEKSINFLIKSSH